MKIIDNNKNFDTINKALKGESIEVIAIPNDTIVYPGNQNDYNKEYCEENNIMVAPIPRAGGTIISFKGNICYFSGGDSIFDSNKGHWFLKSFTKYLQDKGLNAFYDPDTNDVLVDNYKVASFGNGSLPNKPNFYVTAIQIANNLDIDLINKICLKPMHKIPKALSDFGITNEETLNFMIDFFENKKWDKPANE